MLKCIGQIRLLKNIKFAWNCLIFLQLLSFLIFVSPCIFTIQQYFLQQMHSLIFIQSKLAYMFRPIRKSSGQQSVRIPRIQFCQNKQITLKVVRYVAICKMSCVYVIDNVKSWIVKSCIVKSVSSCSLWCGLCWSAPSELLVTRRTPKLYSRYS